VSLAHHGIAIIAIGMRGSLAVIHGGLTANLHSATWA